MREFLYKFSFFRYLAGINCKPTQRRPFVAIILTFYFLLFFYTFSSIFMFNFSAMLCAFLGAMIFVSAALLGNYRNTKPNLATLMPLGFKRRLLYDFLGAILVTVMAILLICAFILIGVLLGIIIAAISGDLTSGEEEAGEAVSLFTGVGVYGGLFSALYCVITYSAGLISSYITRRKYRNIFLACFVVALALGTTLSGLPCISNSGQEFGNFSIALPFVSRCYDYMSLPWLCTLAWCLVAAGMLAAAIYLGYKFHKPKTF